MNFIDIVIIFLIVMGFLVGFKRGFTKSLVSALGLVVIVVLAFYLKNPISVILYENLPFIKIGAFKGIEVINIFFYEALAFLIVLIVLGLILRVLLLATSLFERILNATVILSIPSKIGGAIVGAVEFYVIAFVALYIMSLPFIEVHSLNESKLKPIIFEKTPILSNVLDKGTDVINEFAVLKKKFDDKRISSAEFNKEALTVMLKYKVVTKESLEKLMEKGKIDKFDNYEDFFKEEQ